jgi:membrane peptidoglycan carboxypeptidase
MANAAAADNQDGLRGDAMTMRGPAGDGGSGGDPTVPLPARDLPTAVPRRFGPGGRGRPGGSEFSYVAATATVPAGHGYAYQPHARGPRRHRVRRVLRRLVIAAVVLILLGVVAFGGLMAATPSAGNASQLAAEQASAHQVAYPGPAVPARFAAALTATEDWRFYSEPGIDVYAVARVGFGYVTGHGIGGGATLYQQLAKLLYTEGRSSPKDEATQVAVAIKLYLTYSRPKILQMYTDVVYFGNGFYGLSQASCGYFGVGPSSLSWPQAAMLAGMVQGPSLDDPLTHPANARIREEHVIGRLVATGKLTQAQASAALAVPLSSLVANAGGCPA